MGGGSRSGSREPSDQDAGLTPLRGEREKEDGAGRASDSRAALEKSQPGGWRGNKQTSTREVLHCAEVANAGVPTVLSWAGWGPRKCGLGINIKGASKVGS